MYSDKRKLVRFMSIGRVDAEQICVFPGKLTNISQGGCRGCFPYVLQFDSETDYELKLIPAHKKNPQPFLLIGQPRWQRQDGQTTEIGFEFLHSPGGRQLAAYLEQLKKEERDPVEEMIIETVCEFR
jgi:hypothetical protein